MTYDPRQQRRTAGGEAAARQALQQREQEMEMMANKTEREQKIVRLPKRTVNALGKLAGVRQARTGKRVTFQSLIEQAIDTLLKDAK